MVIIDEPYVSDFLINTLRDQKRSVVSTPVARKLVNDDSLEWVDEKEAIHRIQNTPGLPVYSSSENGLAWLEQNLPESELVHQVNSLKDKLAFRKLLDDLSPGFNYQQVSLEELQNLDAPELTLPLVIKPSVGFFSIGVFVINNEEDLRQAQLNLQPGKLKNFFPASVLNTSRFLLEGFISGEEYAIDYYHDAEGNVIVLNILHHLFASGNDTSDRVYTTSRETITSLENKVKDFLKPIGDRLNLKNFPAHAEIRIDQNGKIRPIEINPLRFGGWCTTGDLLGVTLGFNSYDCFSNNQTPDWESIFKDKENQLFSIIVLNNNSGIEPANIAAFDYGELDRDLENAVVIRKTDFRQYPLFGFVFAETSSSNRQELDKILRSDLRKYIIQN